MSGKASLVALAVLLGASCTGAGHGDPGRPSPSGSSRATQAQRPVYEFATRIQAPRPSGEPDSWDSLLFSARDRVCPSANSYGFHTQDVTAEGAVVAVRCDGQEPRYVQVTFAGVTVPHLEGVPFRVAAKLLSLTGLMVGSVTYERNPPRTTRSGQRISPGDVIQQSVRPGSVLPRGGEIDVIVAKP